MTNKARQKWDAARGKWRIRAIRGGKWWRERGQKSLSMIPHMFTLLNLALGVVSIFLTMEGHYYWAALMVGGSLLADGLDGRLARILKADGEFGKELDSLADVVSFGTAPAILLYKVSLYQLGYYGLLVALLFPMCGALRLARFNIIKTSGFFMGVPITAAGTQVAAFTFYMIQETTSEPVTYFVAALAMALSFLMISTIPYPDFKKLGRKGEISPLVMAAGPVLAMLWVMAEARWNPWAFIVLPLTAYVAMGPWLLIVKQYNERLRPWLGR